MITVNRRTSDLKCSFTTLRSI